MLLPLILLVVGSVQTRLILSTEVVVMEVDGLETFGLSVSMPNESFTKNITIMPVDVDLLHLPTKILRVDFNNTSGLKTYDISINSLGAGKSGVFITSMLLDNSSVNISNETAFLIVEVYTSRVLYTTSIGLGWGYFVAWSVSFYPQIYKNLKRKSVEGLSFDFNWFNLYGYFSYSVFNMGMYYCKMIQDEFAIQNPRSVNPVHLNDIVFSLHSLVVSLVIIIQCYRYEKEGQRVSLTATAVLISYLLGSYVLILLAFEGAMSWLDSLYAWSYIKLSICVTKWIPQIYMNYKRQSTQGCSMESVVLDLIGGILSILQMVFDSINYDDWACITGNPTKLGLGILSILFDIAFVLQHYITWDNGFHIRRYDVTAEPDATVEANENVESTTTAETGYDNTQFSMYDETCFETPRRRVTFANPPEVLIAELQDENYDQEDYPNDENMTTLENNIGEDNCADEHNDDDEEDHAVSSDTETD